MEEAQLIKQLQAGSEKEFFDLVNRYQEDVIKTCFSFVRNWHDAEDIAQEVFITIHKSIQSFKSNSKLSTWIYRITVNKSLNYIRDNKKHLQVTSSLDNENVSLDGLSVHESVENDIEKREKRKLVFESLQKLPKNQRIAIVLRHQMNLSQRETADIMKVTESAIESLMHRAKQKLKEIMIDKVKDF